MASSSEDDLEKVPPALTDTMTSPTHKSHDEGAGRAAESGNDLQQVNSYSTSLNTPGEERDAAPSSKDEGSADPDLEINKTETKDSMHPDAFPDGGMQAWSVVAGGFCALFVSFGWINAIGIFQEVYQTTILKDYSPSTVSWIVSLETFLMFVGGTVVGILFDNYGARPLLFAGTILHVGGLLGASFGSQYWHFILCQGLISPIGASAVFYPSMSSVVTWFNKRRGLALGLMASGSSLGGVIFPIMVQQLVPRIGFGWTMRACDLVILVLLIIANLTVRPRTAPRPRKFNLRTFAAPLGETPFLLLTLSALIIFFGFFIPFTFLPVQSLTVGLSPKLAGYVIPILNAASIFGRITPGHVSDRVGRFNTTVCMTGICGVLTLALWFPARSEVAVLLYALGYGFGSGAFVAIMPALVAAVSPDLRQIGARNGTLFAVISTGALCGNPIAGALLGPTFRYDHLILFAGCFITTGTIIMAGLRFYLGKGKFLVKI